MFRGVSGLTINASFVVDDILMIVFLFSITAYSYGISTLVFIVPVDGLTVPGVFMSQ